VKWKTEGVIDGKGVMIKVVIWQQWGGENGLNGWY